MDKVRPYVGFEAISDRETNAVLGIHGTLGLGQYVATHLSDIEGNLQIIVRSQNESFNLRRC